jgi:hypothetical protein
MRIDARHHVTADLARRSRELVDAIVHERRDEQAQAVPGDRHVIGAAGIQRPLPQHFPARQVERGDIAEIAARDIDRTAVRGHIRILRVVRGARSFSLSPCRIDVEYAEDRAGRNIHQGHGARFRVRDEGDFRVVRRRLRCRHAQRQASCDCRKREGEGTVHCCLRYGGLS